MSRVSRQAARAGLLIASLAAVACSTSEAPPSERQGTTTGAGMAIEFRSESVPPTAGENVFVVTVTKDSAPVSDATVTAVFSMPAMPSMNMPEMRTTVTLAPDGEGRYRGTGQLSMGGTWNVHVTATRDSKELGSKSLSIVAK
jgi:nitrogen fixation protein FixH